MIILGIDTSSRAGSAALIEDGEIREEVAGEAGISFSRGLLAMVDSLLARHRLSLPSLSALAVACGPGSFTGIRIGLASAHGMALASGVPVVGVSTLEAIARVGGRDGEVVPVINAENGKVYHARFAVRGGNAKRITEDALGESSALPSDAPRVGAEWPAERIITRSVAAGAALCAGKWIREGRAPGRAPAVPNYVRQSAAEKNIMPPTEG